MPSNAIYGVVKNGKVKLDAPCPWPDWTRVHIYVVKVKKAGAAGQRKRKK